MTKVEKIELMIENDKVVKALGFSFVTVMWP